MKIHTNKKAMRMRVVLLVVGIVILSAKECEMGPGGDKSFAYICTNGTVAEGTSEAENTQKCSACDANFELTSDKQCVDEAFAYICTNGTAADGTTETENTENCSSCETGLGLNGANECVDNVPPAVVTNLAASLPMPLVGTVQLDWTDPNDTDFSHVLISWTPNAPTNPIRVNTGTRTTVIPASGLTVGTAYTFTAVSVDTLGNESAASTGTTAVIPLHTPDALFATTVGTTYAPQVNVVSGSGAIADPYVIPLVAGVAAATPIVIEFNHSGETLAASSEYFRITNMPTGATYTSSTFAWAYKSTSGLGRVGLHLREDGATPAVANPGAPKEIATSLPARGAMLCGVAFDESCAMNTVTSDTSLMPTGARTVTFSLSNPSATDSITLTLAP